MKHIKKWVTIIMIFLSISCGTMSCGRESEDKQMEQQDKFEKENENIQNKGQKESSTTTEETEEGETEKKCNCENEGTKKDVVKEPKDLRKQWEYVKKGLKKKYDDLYFELRKKYIDDYSNNFMTYGEYLNQDNVMKDAYSYYLYRQKKFEEFSKKQSSFSDIQYIEEERKIFEIYEKYLAYCEYEFIESRKHFIELEYKQCKKDAEGFERKMIDDIVNIKEDRRYLKDIFKKEKQFLNRENSKYNSCIKIDNEKDYTFDASYNIYKSSKGGGLEFFYTVDGIDRPNGFGINFKEFRESRGRRKIIYDRKKEENCVIKLCKKDRFICDKFKEEVFLLKEFEI
jgi:hypothetical protein